MWVSCLTSFMHIDDWSKGFTVSFPSVHVTQLGFKVFVSTSKPLTKCWSYSLCSLVYPTWPNWRCHFWICGPCTTGCPFSIVSVNIPLRAAYSPPTASQHLREMRLFLFPGIYRTSWSVKVYFRPLQFDSSEIVPLPAAWVLMPLMPPTKVFSDGLKVVNASWQFDTWDPARNVCNHIGWLQIK